jgi:hypothetical protein
VASIFKRMSGFLSRVKSMARVFADADDSCTRIGSGKLSALFLPVDVVTPNYSSTLSNPHLILGDRREDLSPKRTGDLHSHVTNPARSRVHQHLLAGTDIRRQINHQAYDRATGRAKMRMLATTPPLQEEAPRSGRTSLPSGHPPRPPRKKLPVNVVPAFGSRGTR